MKLTYTLNGRANPKTLKRGMNGARGMLAECFRVRMNGGWFAYMIGYLRAMPYEFYCENKPDGKVEVSYNFWLADPQDAALVVAVIRLKLEQGRARANKKSPTTSAGRVAD